MSEKRLEIKLTGDHAELIAANRRLADSLTNVEKIAERAGKAIDRMSGMGHGGNGSGGGGAGAGANGNPAAAVAGLEKASAARVNIAEREKARLQAIEDRFAATEYKREVDRQKRAERMATAAVSAAEKEKARLQSIEDQFAAREYRRQVDRIRRQDEAAAQEAAAKEREKAKLQEIEDRWAARDYRARVQHEKRKLEESQKAAEQTKAMWSKVGDAATALTGFAGLATVIGSVKAAFESANKAAIDSAKLVRDYRESLRELAMLKGMTGQDTELVKQQMKLRGQTLQTAGEATEFQLQALGAGEAAIGKNISKTEWEKLMVMGGQFQAAEGGAASAHGLLTGMMPRLMGGNNQTAEQLFGKEAELYSIFQPGGGTYSQRVDQYLKSAPLISAGLYSPQEAAALHSAFSQTAPDQSATLVEQFTRATVGGLGKLRGTNLMEMPGDEEQQKQGEYLQGLGGKPGMKPTEIGKLIVGDLAKRKREAAGKGETFDPYHYLGTQGFRNQEDIKSILGFSDLVQGGQWAGYEDMLAKPKGPGEAMSKIDAFRKSATGAERSLSVTGEMTKAQRGVDSEYYEQVMRLALQKLQARGELTGGTYEEYQNAGLTDPIKMFQRRRIFGEATNMLEAERARLGIGSFNKTRSGYGPAAAYEGFATTDEIPKFAASAREIAKAGGNVLPGFEEFSRQMQVQTDLLRDIRDGAPAAPPAPLRPAAGQAGRF